MTKIELQQFQLDELRARILRQRSQLDAWIPLKDRPSLEPPPYALPLDPAPDILDFERW